MNNELEQLKTMKKEIDRKIKELTYCETTVGNVRIGMEHYPTAKPDRWYLGFSVQNINRKDIGGMRKISFRAVVNGMSKEDVVGAIPGLIKDLQEMYEKAVKK